MIYKYVYYVYSNTSINTTEMKETAKGRLEQRKSTLPRRG
jgi:hypothetical protein